jgi:hypothetical protein
MTCLAADERAAFCDYLRRRGYADATVKGFAQKVNVALAAGVTSPDEVGERLSHRTANSYCVVRTAFRAYEEFRGAAA